MADYFVDPVNGLDANPGTSQAAPKKTWHGLQTDLSGVLGAGHNFYGKAGTTYRAADGLPALTYFGAAQITSYGAADTPHVIDFGSAGSTSSGFECSNTPGVIRRLVITGGKSGGRLVKIGPNSGEAFTLLECTLQGYGQLQDNVRLDQGTNATIDSCTLDYCTDDNIWMQLSNNVTIRRNRISGSEQAGGFKGDCIQTNGGCSNLVIEYNDMRNLLAGKQCVIVGNNSGGAVRIENNRMEGGAKVLNVNQCVATIKGNVLLGYGVAGTPPDDAMIAYSFSAQVDIQNNILDCQGFKTYGIRGDGPGTSINIQHNVILNALQYNMGLFNTAGLPVMVRNNILGRPISPPADGGSMFIGGVPSSLTINGNVYLGPEYANMFYVDPSLRYSTLAAFKAAGYEARGQLVSSHGFYDASRPWLGLRPDSPCWNAGTFIQGARDRYGRMYPVPSHVGPWAVKR